MRALTVLNNLWLALCVLVGGPFQMLWVPLHVLARDANDTNGSGPLRSSPRRPTTRL